mgnify:CR=1 FL=1
MAYKHTNSKGITYYLHKTEVTLRGGKPQTIYFFAKVEKNAKGEPVDLPEDRIVKVSLLFQRKNNSCSISMLVIHSYQTNRCPNILASNSEDVLVYETAAS